MRQSSFFTKTLKTISSEEQSKNAQLLLRGGFIYKNSAGVYSYLPLGWRVIQNISQIIREEMNAIGATEMLMPALVEKRYLDTTKRSAVDVGFSVTGQDQERAPYILGWTHEEVITEIATRYIQSWRDLPVAAYQIQTKFRNEPRAKNGLLRGREFIMKDLYSFHKSKEDLLMYYETVRRAYDAVFARVGLKAYYTVATGGDFTMSTTNEFQVLADAGEDTIYYKDGSSIAFNQEVVEESGEYDVSDFQKGSAIEVGNIFPLGTKYADAFDLTWHDEKDAKQKVYMGSYGIGVSRVMATIVEVCSDDKGIIWNPAVAPFVAHVIPISDDDAVVREAEKVYEALKDEGYTVLLDDRDVRPGEKFADSDLIGIPFRIAVSQKTIEQNGYGLKQRDQEQEQIYPLPDLKQHIALRL